MGNGLSQNSSSPTGLQQFTKNSSQSPAGEQRITGLGKEDGSLKIISLQPPDPSAVHGELWKFLFHKKRHRLLIKKKQFSYRNSSLLALGLNLEIAQSHSAAVWAPGLSFPWDADPKAGFRAGYFITCCRSAAPVPAPVTPQPSALQDPAAHLELVGCVRLQPLQMIFLPAEAFDLQWG